MSFPGSCNFIGEVLVLLSIFDTNKFVFIFCCLGTMFCVIYSVWTYNRIFFGNIKRKFFFYFKDLYVREFYILSMLCVFIVFLGIFPQSLNLLLSLFSLKSFLALNLYFCH